MQIILDVADRDPPEEVPVQQPGLTLVQESLQRASGDRIPVRTICRDIEQHYLQPGVGQLTGDAESHRPRSDDRGSVDLIHEAFICPGTGCLRR